MKSSSTWLVQRFPHILGGICIAPRRRSSEENFLSLLDFFTSTAPSYRPYLRGMDIDIAWSIALP